MENTSGENAKEPNALGGLDPADLLKQGAAEDTLVDGAQGPFDLPPIGELQEIFPQFEILGLIGKGGMGAVYQVRQRELDRIVAMKILPPEIGDRPGFAERFTREAKALAKLNHPGIVTLHEFGQSQGLYFILMEYVDGVNLRELLLNGRIAPREALAIVPQICDALQFAHDRGIIHRDIKPENILLDRLGRVKVADFGLAKLAGVQDPQEGGDATDVTLHTEVGKVMGTPQYMAPEQIETPSEVDHRADIYALGVVFYQMLTGELPGRKLEAPSMKVRMDVRLDEVVLRALEKDPAMRFQQASVMKTKVEDAGEPAPVRQGGNPWNLDYRSKTHWFGLPLLHVTSGPDPETGKERIAKGIIAIGGHAIGGLAIGGRATGVIATGGITTGIVSFGGIAVGLISSGGLALGLIAALGGMAIAPVAIGGNAIGYYSFGGSAHGVHALGPNIQDPVAMAFFHPWSIKMMMSIGFALPTVGAFVFLVGFGVPMMVMRKLASPKTATVRPADGKKLRLLAVMSFLVAAVWAVWMIGDFGSGGKRQDQILPVETTGAVPLNTPQPDIRGLAWMEQMEANGGKPEWTLTGAKYPVTAEPLPVAMKVGDEHAEKKPRFLSLWIKQDQFDPFSSPLITVYRRDGRTPLDLPSGAGSTATSGNIVTATICVGTLDEIPLSTMLEMRYGVGNWEKRGRLFGENEITIDNGIRISRPTQTDGGKASIQIERAVPEQAGERQYDLVAVTKSGQRISSAGRSRVVSKTKEVKERYEFDLPLMKIDYFEIRSRIIRNAQWEVPLPPMQEITVELQADGQVQVAGEAMSLAEFIRRMKLITTYDPEQKVTIRSSLTTRHARIVEMLEACAQAGIRNVGFGTGAEGNPQAIIEQGKHWLGLIDKGSYAASWEQSGQFFQKAISSKAWEASLESLRKPLGEPESRKVRGTSSSKSLPGAPDGDYLIIQFDVVFANKKAAVETLTLSKEADGVWRASGYYIQ